MHFLAGITHLQSNEIIFTDDEDTRPSGVHSTKMGPEDINLHVHSDHGTGGHWCAKIFFFSLLAILLGLIGLILLENRGLADCKYTFSSDKFISFQLFYFMLYDNCLFVCFLISM